MIRLKQGIDLIDMLRQAGYSTYKLRGKAKEGKPVLSQDALQNLAAGKLPSWKTLDKLCDLLGCVPSDLIGYVSNAPAVTSEMLDMGAEIANTQDTSAWNPAIEYHLTFVNEAAYRGFLTLVQNDTRLMSLVNSGFSHIVKFTVLLSNHSAVSNLLSDKPYRQLISEIRCYQ